MEIFYDILNAIKNEATYDEVKPTRIQQQCNMSYDKFSKNLEELLTRNLVAQNSSLEITKEGFEFLNDYSKINDFLTKMKINYLYEEENLHEI